MRSRAHLVVLVVVVLSLLFLGITYGGDLLFDEEIEENATIYRVSADGSSLRKIGNGLFPQWVPHKNFVSYFEFKPFGEFIVADSEGKEIYRIKEIKNIESILSYSWSPKGNGIAFASSIGRQECLVRYYDMVTKQLRLLYGTQIESLGEALWGTTLEWLPDSERFLFSTAESSKGQGIALIDAKKEMVRKLPIEGKSPRYFESNKILFPHDSEVWVVNTDGRNNNKLISAGAPIVYLSKVRGGKVILQTFEMNTSEKLPSRLFLLDLQNNRSEEIKTKGHVLFCPRFSPDGRQFTAIGLCFNDNQSGTEEEPKPGYYVFDLINKKVTLLKTFDFSGSKGYWFGIYLAGYGNHSNWK